MVLTHYTFPLRAFLFISSLPLRSVFFFLIFCHIPQKSQNCQRTHLHLEAHVQIGAAILQTLITGYV